MRLAPLTISAALLAAPVGCSCSCAGNVGDPCDEAACRAGLLCDPVTRTCQPAGSDASSDAVASAGDAATTEAGLADSGGATDAVPPADSAAASDAAACALDAAIGCVAPPMELVPPPCYRACQSPSDCSWADVDCCTCASGGGSIAINTAFASAWAADLAAACIACSGLACVDVDLCPGAAPSCVMGMCQ